MEVIMKSLCALVLIAGLLLPVSPALAAMSFPSEDIQILESKDITALTDDKLVDDYIDILSEIEAARAFHMTSGFTIKEYNKYKEIIKYRLRLMFEINRRKIEIPAAAK
jgi:hypothetical protein